MVWTSQNANQQDLPLEKDGRTSNYTAPQWRAYFSNFARYLSTLGVTDATPNALKCTPTKACYVNSDKATLSGQFQKPT